MNSYRLNVRFNLDNDAEMRAVEYLQHISENSKKTMNGFIVEAVIEKIKSQNAGRNFSLDDIRTVIREELQEISFFSSAQPKTDTVNTELTEEQKAENEKNVLADLEMFM